MERKPFITEEKGQKQSEGKDQRVKKES